MNEDFHIEQIGNAHHSSSRENPQCGRVYSPDGLAPTLRTFQGGGLEPLVVSYTRDNFGHVLSYHTKEIANTIHTATASGGTTDQYIKEAKTTRVRKLTERECFRLMDVSDSDIDKIQASGISKSQQIKMAGNSIVVSVLEAIFENLFFSTDEKTELVLPI